MDVKVSIILPIREINDALFSFVLSLNRQSLEETEILMFSEFYEKEENTLKRLFPDNKKIRFYSYDDLNNIPHNEIINGEYVYFADVNAFLYRDMLEIMYRCTKSSGCDVMMCNYEFGTRVLNVQKEVFASKLKEPEIFKPASKSDNLFNLTTLSLSNYFFSSDFILKNQLLELLEQNFDLSSQLIFIMKALICAEKIEYLPSKAVKYEKFNDFSAENWKNICFRFNDFHKELEEKELLHTYEKAFLYCYLVCIRLMIVTCENISKYAEILHYFKNKVNKRYDFFRRGRMSSKTRTFEEMFLLSKSNVPYFNKNKKSKFYEKNINIVIPADEESVPYTGVAISSLSEHISEHNFYNIYVMHNGLSFNAINRISNLNGKNIKIYFYNVSKIMNDLFVSAKYNADFFKYAVPKIFSDYDNILYMDNGVQCLEDVAKIIEKFKGKNKPIILIKNNKEDAMFENYPFILFNPTLCNKNFIAEKLSMVYQNSDMKDGVFNIESMKTFCKKEIISDNFYRVGEKSLAQEKQQNSQWMQYLRNSDFYEWLLYNYLKE